MTDKLKNQIKKYLDKTYYIKEGRILTRGNDVHEWGVDVVEFISGVFNSNHVVCSEILLKWLEEKAVPTKDINNLWGARKLKYSLSIDMARDLERLGVSNVQGQMINLVIDELSKEIDTTILKQLKQEIKTLDELTSLIKCIGYGISDVLYNPATFLPEKKFLSVKYHEMLNERQSNNIWQNHFRPTRVDEQTQVTS